MGLMRGAMVDAHDTSVCLLLQCSSQEGVYGILAGRAGRCLLNANLLIFSHDDHHHAMRGSADECCTDMDAANDAIEPAW